MRPFRFILFFFFALFSIEVFSQADTYHYLGDIGFNNDELYDTQISVSGNEQISCGRTTLPFFAGGDAIVVEVNNCKESFVRSYTTNTPPGIIALEEFVAMKSTPSGQYLIVGTSVQLPLFSTPSDLIVALLNSDGTVAQATTVDIGPGNGEVGREVLFDAAGNFYLIGIANSSTPSHFVIKLDPGLNLIWASLISGSVSASHECRAIITTADRLFVAGTRFFGGDFIPYVAEIDLATGALLNQVTFSYPSGGGMIYAQVEGIDEDQSTDNLVVLGYRPGSPEQVWVVEMNYSLSPPFTGISVGHNIISEFPEDITYNSVLGEVVVVGSSGPITGALAPAFLSRFRFGGGPNLLRTILFPGVPSATFARFTSIEWDAIHNGYTIVGQQNLSPGTDEFWITSTEFNGFVNCGEFETDWNQIIETWDDAGSGLIATPTTLSFPYEVIEVPVTYSLDRTCSNCPYPKNSGSPSKTISLWPNPASDRIHFSLPEAWSSSTATILDAQGKTVLRFTATDLEMEADISHLPAGIYLATFTQASGQSSTLKFVVE